MREDVFKTTVGALLHDIGKVLYRTGQYKGTHQQAGNEFLSNCMSGEKEILDCVLHHHSGTLKNAGLADDSPAHVVYIADNIAAGADRRKAETEGDKSAEFNFDPMLPMHTVFNKLNGNSTSKKLKATIADRIVYPEDNVFNTQGDYNLIYSKLKQGLTGLELSPGYIDSILELLEATLTYIPSSTNKEEVPDISLFDHMKITAAIASCIMVYLSENNRMNYCKELFQNENAFYNEKSFIMFSCDISGIQKFIYTIVSKDALKMLRSRSFYLELMLEHIVDLLLNETGLSRANLIYTGGGHAYILFPNTESIRMAIEKTMKSVNLWFINNYKTALYIAYASTECSGNELKNHPLPEKVVSVPLRDVYSSLSTDLSMKKQNRYTIEEIISLNTGNPGSEGRECRVCGATDEITTNEEEGTDICVKCNSLIKISPELIKDDVVVLTSKTPLPDKNSVKLPGLNGNDNYFCATNKEEIIKLLKHDDEKVLKVYGINKFMSGVKYSTKLWMGSYFYKRKDGRIATIEDLAEGSEGIERVAVLRADIDYLGRTFISGFIRDNETENNLKYKYLTLSRTATLSRQLSVFFKKHINDFLSGNSGINQSFTLVPGAKKENKERKAIIVYSGGDDLFIIGSWNDCIELAVDIRNAFKKFSCNSLTISGGIGFFNSGYPVARMAAETEKLENASKKFKPDNMNEKNAVTLFEADTNTYNWDTLENKVFGEKLTLIYEYMSMIKTTDKESASGNSFLYKILEHIRCIEDRINIARIAYLLSRLAPDKNDKDEVLKEVYSRFQKKIYKWIFNNDDRKELETAILIYAYLNRKNENKER